MKRIFQVVYIIIILCLLISCSKKNEDKDESKENIENSESLTLSIQEIGDGYFLAVPPWPSPENYKVFASLDKDFCIGDYVDVYYDEMTETSEKSYEITAKLVAASDFELKENVCYKPVIYLYPTVKTKVSVLLDYNGTLTHTYPTYSKGWKVTAYPNGTLIDENGIDYPYLFWEGESAIEYDTSKGFCVSGHQTEQFLRNKLGFMGLSQKESEDFIEFWIPFMENNSYNKISFQTTAYTENAKLTVYPEPDSILRIYMVFQPLDEFVDVEEQHLSKFERTGFALVEWGGGIIKQ
ncbi:MAG: hypothetical protein K0S01_1196 [Herbinix sp.]|jgi:hypothetical protein|nr:hypothetical protein [Herbinix sp.]